MVMPYGDICTKKNTRKETRNKFVEEYKKIYSRKYRRAHYRNKWEIASDNHMAEEDFKVWCLESKLVMRKHKIGLITDEEMQGYFDLWNRQDLETKQKIDKISISKNIEKTLDKI